MSDFGSMQQRIAELEREVEALKAELEKARKLAVPPELPEHPKPRRR